MKLKIITFISLVALTLAFVNGKKEHDQVNHRLAFDMLQLEITVNEFIATLDQNEDLETAYRNCRRAYKRVETYSVFRYPTLDKSINGGPVPSIETDIVILHKDDPHGLQVIEELINAETIDRNALSYELTLLKKNITKLKQALELRQVEAWEVLEANHLALTRIMTLGLSGFDSPEYLLSLSDAKTVLEVLMLDLEGFRTNRNTNEVKAEVLDLASSAISRLKAARSFEALDRYSMYREVLLPLQSKIKEMHQASGYEFYDEVSTNQRPITRAGHLFAADYLNPMFSTRSGIAQPNDDQAHLGKILFYDPVLSGNLKRSCASCHNPAQAYTDNLPQSKAYDGEHFIIRNSPTLINSAYQSKFFHDMRSSDMNDQIAHVFFNEDELNISLEEITRRLRSSSEYRQLFKKAFDSFEEPISISTIKTALEQYIRTLTAMNSKFDRNIRAEENTLTPLEIEGANLFMGKAACATCHFPPAFNGYVPPHFIDTEGEILGVLDTVKGKQIDADRGVYERFRLSNPDAHFVDGMFKTSTVRNIEYTAPYMHNGRYTTLEDVVDFYTNGGAIGAGFDLPQQTLAGDSLKLNNREKNALVAFMKTLSDTTGMVQQPFKLPELSAEYTSRIWGGEY